MGENVGPAAGALKAFRALRLLRIIKLARRWTALQEILGKMVASLESIAIFTMLLILFMYIFALLGMQFFAKMSIQDLDGEFVLREEIIERYSHEILIPVRLSFDNIYLSMNTIFVIIMADGWNMVMYENIVSTGKNWAPYAIFFVILFTLGNKIMLSLFTAILLSNFEGGDEEDETPFKVTGDEEIDAVTQKPHICRRIFNMKHVYSSIDAIKDVFGYRKTHKTLRLE